MTRLAQVVVPLDCGGTILLTIDVDPAHCRNVGHMCPSPHEVAASLRGALIDQEREAERQQ